MTLSIMLALWAVLAYLTAAATAHLTAGETA